MPVLEVIEGSRAEIMEFVNGHPEARFRVSRVEATSLGIPKHPIELSSDELKAKLIDWTRENRPSGPLLSDYAVSREGIYEGVGE